VSAPPETRRCSRSPSIERTRGTRSRHDAQLVRCASLTHSARKHSSRSSASSFPFAASSHTLFLNRAVQRTLFSKQRTVFSSLFVRGSSLPTSYLEAKRGLCGTASSSDEGDRKEQTASVCNRRCAMAPRSPTDLRLAHHAVLALGLFSLCPCCTGQRRGEGEREGE
jgi:hypothetical protein